MKKINGRSRTGPHKRDVTGTNPKKQTSERSTQHSKQPTHEHDMICGMRYAMHMHDLTSNEIQVCHWKGEMKSLENDIKITGIGVTVWKWQAIQI